MAVRYFGVTKNLDLDPSLIKPDVRPFRYKINEMIISTSTLGFIFLIGAIFLLPFINHYNYQGANYDYTEILVFVSFIWYYLTSSRKREYLFRRPLGEDDIDFDEDTGLMYLGYDMEDFSTVWFAKDDLCVHFLVFGSTGSGKSRFLLGILYQAMLIGTGTMYVDGKGDSSIFWLVYSFCRRLGREDDLLVINYLTGGDTIDPDSPFSHRISNTNNPMSYGTADNLNSLVVGLMREAGGDGAMWKGRARTMLKGLLNALVFKRDNENLNLDIMEIRSYFPLDKIRDLSKDNNLEDKARDPLKKYLGELPGYSEQQATAGDIPAKALEQHNFLTMQLTEVMSDLSETYGFIFGVPLGEVDFKDVVFNRRILFVLLPALEKDPDALEGLGKLVIAGVRSALAPALGNRLEGTKREVLEVKPTKSKTPFFLICDEYGYYSVTGFAVVAAQARSLNISVTFAGQNYPSFKQASESEANATVANTNIKIAMKIEDPDDTFKIFESRGGDAEVATSSGQEIKDTLMSGYADQRQTRIETKKRVNVRDIVNQDKGQAHLMYGDIISHVQFFWYDPYEAHEAQINSFLMLDKPKPALVHKILNANTKLTNILEGKENISGSNEIMDKGLRALLADMTVAGMFNQDNEDASIHALGMIEVRHSIKDIELISKVNNINVVAEYDDVDINELSEGSLIANEIAKELAEANANRDSSQEDSSDINSDDDQMLMPTAPVSNGESDEINAFVSSMSELDEDDILQVLADEEDVSDDMFNEALLVDKEFGEILESTVKSNIEKKHDYDSSTMSPVNQLDNVKEGSSKVIELLGESRKYPEKPLPSKIEQDVIEDTLASILSQIDEQETSDID